MQITQTIQKWGNGTAVRLPQKVLKAAHVAVGQELTVSLQGNVIVLTPVVSPKKVTLESLVSRITPQNRHDEVDWGAPVGKELW